MRAASRAIAFEPAGEQALKGKSAPVPAWRAVRVVAERGGRNRCRGARAAVRRSRRGARACSRTPPRHRHATGAPGSSRSPAPPGSARAASPGSSRSTSTASLEPMYWHQGRSPAYGDGLTFWALGEMVRRRAGLLEDDDEPTTRAAVARLPRRVRARRGGPPLDRAGPPRAPGPRRRAAGRARRPVRRLADVLRARSPPRGTTVLVFEDLQWADGGLLDFIEHLLGWAKGAPILVVTLARPELLDRRPELGRRAAARGASLALEPLADAAMRDLVARLVPGLPDAAVTAIVERADGIPLYAVETIRMLLVEGRLEPADGAYRPVGELADARRARDAPLPRRRPARRARSRRPGACSRMPRSSGRRFTLDGPRGGQRASAGGDSSRASETSSDASCSPSTPIPARPSAASTPSSRLSSARSPTAPSPEPTGGRATSPRPATSSRSATTSSPAPSPPTTSPPTAPRQMDPRQTPSPSRRASPSRAQPSERLPWAPTTRPSPSSSRPSRSRCRRASRRACSG